MPGPFYNAIKGTTAGTPGTGAFTPNAASSGFRAWSAVPTGWIGLVRYEDGSDWELSYSYWNGTTLSRGTNQRFASSTGSLLTLTAAATAAMVADASELQSHLGGTSWRGYVPIANSTATPTAIGLGAATVTGTATGGNVAATNFLTEQTRSQTNSATTANAQAGYSSSAAFALISTTAGRGGCEFVARLGPAQLPTGPRLFVGLTATTFVGNTGEPSALNAKYAVFAKDSGDTNIQLMVNNSTGAATKTDTGIPLVATAWYEASIWFEPGSNTVNALLIRLDTGDIFYTSTSSGVPATGTICRPELLGGLSATTGTAFQMCMGSMLIRGGC